MKGCVIRVQSLHHLDAIIGRVRSLGGKYAHHKYLGVPSVTVYTLYQGWLDMGLPVYVWLVNQSTGLTAYLHNHNCGCEVMVSVQDAVEYLGLGGE